MAENTLPQHLSWGMVALAQRMVRELDKLLSGKTIGMESVSIEISLPTEGAPLLSHVFCLAYGGDRRWHNEFGLTRCIFRSANNWEMSADDLIKRRKKTFLLDLTEETHPPFASLYLELMARINAIFEENGRHWPEGDSIKIQLEVPEGLSDWNRSVAFYAAAEAIRGLKVIPVGPGVYRFELPIGGGELPVSQR